MHHIETFKIKRHVSSCADTQSKPIVQRTPNSFYDVRFLRSSRRRVWRWLSSGLLRRAVWKKFTDFPMVLAETSVNSYQSTRSITHKTAIFWTPFSAETLPLCRTSSWCEVRLRSMQDCWCPRSRWSPGTRYNRTDNKYKWFCVRALDWSCTVNSFHGTVWLWVFKLRFP
jgi:hypothetical protein